MSEYERLPYDEIVRLTGKTQHAAQLRALRRMGVRAYRLDNGKGPVCVLKCWLVARDAQATKSKPVLKSDRENPYDLGSGKKGFRELVEGR